LGSASATSSLGRFAESLESFFVEDLVEEFEATETGADVGDDGADAAVGFAVAFDDFLEYVVFGTSVVSGDADTVGTAIAADVASLSFCCRDLAPKYSKFVLKYFLIVCDNQGYLNWPT
jgi:hypothetical protein